MTTAAALAAPERSLQQRMDALAHGNVIRTHRARLKVDIARGRKLASTVIADPGENVLTMKVFDLLLAVPKTGRVKANKMIGALRVSPSKSLGGLSERQRGELVSMLRASEQRTRRVHG